MGIPLKILFLFFVIFQKSFILFFHFLKNK